MSVERFFIIIKVVILGRVAGSELELSTLAIENLVPDALRTKNTLDFMNDLPKFDAHFAALQDKATAKDCVLRYVGTVNGTKSRAGLEMFPTSHPFASLKGSDNIIAFKTKRFPNGLIVQGSGAGDQVTAFGMFSDLLKIATSVTQQPVSFS